VVLLARFLIALLVWPPCGNAQTAASSYPIHGTFLNFYRLLTPELWGLEFQKMKDFDIDTVVLISIGHLQPDAADPLGYRLAPDGLLYPSLYLPAAEHPPTDTLEMILSRADQQSMKVLVGSLQTAQDWTDGTEFNALHAYNHRVALEILQRYGRHPSLRGWYFTQEIWMNWVRYYGEDYYGTHLMADWVSDMRSIDPGKVTSGVLVVKKTGQGVMPGLSASELQAWTARFVQAVRPDVLMAEDGAGAGNGAPSIADLPVYFGALSTGIRISGTNTRLWGVTETFAQIPGLSGEQYPPAAIARIQRQLQAVQPYVAGYISWIFGDDLSPQAAHYPVQASELGRRYRYLFKPQTIPDDDVIPIVHYWYLTAPDARYPDSAVIPKLSDRTGGACCGGSLDSWVGFADARYNSASARIVADLQSVRSIRQARALVLSWTSAGVYHPDRMEVDVSTDGMNWNSLGMTNSFPTDAPNFAVMWGEVTGSASARYVRWTFRYHQWLMLAEFEVIGPPP
jgi:hypothetical protein